MVYEIYTPDSLCVSGDAYSITFSLTDGELCVLDGHAPAFLSLYKGQLIIKNGSASKIYDTGKGAAQIKDNKAFIFVEHCEAADKKELIEYHLEKRYKKKDKKSTDK